MSLKPIIDETISHTSELERMINLLAIMADVMRQLARTQSDVNKSEIRGLADAVDGVASRLVDILFPASVDRH